MTEQDKMVVLEDNHRLRTENDQLRKERDEARGEVCELVSKDCGELDLYGADREAKRRGWATYNR